MTPNEALAALNALRCNIIATQDASWSNTVYPLVAILNEAGLTYSEPDEGEKLRHLTAYGGAGGYPALRRSRLRSSRERRACSRN